MRIVKQLLAHKVALVCIVVLLIVQAVCDLSLPHFTSEMVDVGIAQGGFEHESPDTMSKETYQAVRMFAQAGVIDPSFSSEQGVSTTQALDADKGIAKNQQSISAEEADRLIAASYKETADGTYVLSDDVQRDALDEAIRYPLALYYEMKQAAPEEIEQRINSTASSASDSSDEVFGALIAEAQEKLSLSNGQIAHQLAIMAAKSEAEAAGSDVQAVQMDFLLSVGGLMLLATLIGALSTIGVAALASRSAARIAHDLRAALFSRVVTFSDAEIQSFSAASLITRGTNDIQQIQVASIIMMRLVLYAPILALGGIVMILTTDVQMSWVIIVAVGLVFAVMGTLMAVAGPKFRIMQTLIDRVNLVARETLNGLFVIRAFNRQDFEQQRFDDASKDLMKTQLFTNRVMVFMQPLMMFIMNMVSVAVVWFGGHYIDAGSMNVGDLIAFISYAMVIIMSFMMMSVVAIMLPRANVAAARVEEVIATEPCIKDAPITRDQELSLDEGLTIQFDRVSFSYENSSDEVLHEVSFTVPAGTTTAIIGSTGSGKSTILKLLMRSYDVSKGAIYINGIDIKEVSLATLRSLFGYIPQKSFLFGGTIQSNVAFSRASQDKDELERAARIAQALSFIESKDEKWDTPISQGGSNVSGGQRQRLTIARAIAANPHALLFDDSSSALDYATEARLREALSRELPGKTQIVIAQRVAGVRFADTIVVLDQGRVVGQGKHHELMQTCPVYQQIAQSQLSSEELQEGDR